MRSLYQFLWGVVIFLIIVGIIKSIYGGDVFVIMFGLK